MEALIAYGIRKDETMSRKHKDLDKAHALLKNEGWHIIEVGQLKTSKRDKRRCVHYNTTLKSCRLFCLCNGSYNCKCYREW